MKKTAILLILFIFTEFLAGCQGQTPDRLAGLLDDSANSPAIAVSSSSDGANGINTSTPPSGSVASPVNFYPDAGLTTASSNTEIVLTDKLKMKLYLVEKYKPGICFGEPAGPMNETVASYLQENSALAKFVRNYYKISSDLEVYAKVQQLEGINLTRGQNGKYLYRFVDGQCCNLTTYEGEINIINIDIFENLLRHSTKNPC